MNIMLVTVTERPVKSEFASDRGFENSYFTAVLMESVVLSMLGCLIGVFLSWAVLRIISVVVSSLSMSFSLRNGGDRRRILFVIGIVFGLYPANKRQRWRRSMRFTMAVNE